VLEGGFARYARDLGALGDLLERLVQAALAPVRGITFPLLRDVLQAGDSPH
jgi:DnaA family protein